MAKSRKSSEPWITMKGKLGGRGFLSRPSSEQHSILRKCVKNYGYKSCLGSIQALERSRKIKHKYGSKLSSLRHWIVNQEHAGKFGIGHQHHCGCTHNMGFSSSGSTYTSLKMKKKVSSGKPS